MNIAEYRKMIAGFVLGGLSALATAYGDNKVTTGEWITIAIVALGTAFGVWAVPNKPPSLPMKPAEPAPGEEHLTG